MTQLADVLRLLPAPLQGLQRLWGGYTLQWLTLGATASGLKASTTTQGDMYFVATRIMASATDNASPPAELAAAEVTLTMTLGPNALFPDANPVHLNNFLVGSTSDHGGHELEFPMLVAPSTALTAFATNLTGATVMNVRLTFYGFHITQAPRGISSL